MEDGRVENEREAKRKPRRFYAVSRFLKRANATTTASRMTSNPIRSPRLGGWGPGVHFEEASSPQGRQDSRNLNRPQERASSRLELSLSKPGKTHPARPPGLSQLV